MLFPALLLCYLLTMSHPNEPPRHPVNWNKFANSTGNYHEGYTPFGRRPPAVANLPTLTQEALAAPQPPEDSDFADVAQNGNVQYNSALRYLEPWWQFQP